MVDYRGRLTDEEKKAHHIESERRRRDAIRRSFDALAAIVPDMEGQARSESVMLQATVSYLTNLLDRKEDMRDLALARGITEAEFEAVYDSIITTLPEVAEAKQDDNAPPTGGDGRAKGGRPSGGKADNKNKASRASASKPTVKTPVTPQSVPRDTTHRGHSVVNPNGLPDKHHTSTGRAFHAHPPSSNHMGSNPGVTPYPNTAGASSTGRDGEGPRYHHVVGNKQFGGAPDAKPFGGARDQKTPGRSGRCSP